MSLKTTNKQESQTSEESEPTVLRRSSRVLQRRLSETEAPPSPQPAKILRSRRTSKDVDNEEKPKTTSSILEENKADSPGPAKRGRRSSITRDLPAGSPAAPVTRRRSIQLEETPVESPSKPKTRRSSITKEDEEVPERRTRRRSTDTVPKRRLSLTENLEPIEEDKSTHETIGQEETLNLSVIKEDSLLEQEADKEKHDSNIMVTEESSPEKNNKNKSPSKKEVSKECNASEATQEVASISKKNTSKINLSLKKLNDEVEEAFTLELTEEETVKKPTSPVNVEKLEVLHKTPEKSQGNSPKRYSPRKSSCLVKEETLTKDTLLEDELKDKLANRSASQSPDIFQAKKEEPEIPKDSPRKVLDVSRGNEFSPKRSPRLSHRGSPCPLKDTSLKEESCSNSISPKRSPRLAHKGSPCLEANTSFKENNLTENEKSDSEEPLSKDKFTSKISSPKRSPRLSHKESPHLNSKENDLKDTEKLEKEDSDLTEECIYKPITPKRSPRLSLKGSPCLKSNVSLQENTLSKIKDSPDKMASSSFTMSPKGSPGKLYISVENLTPNSKSETNIKNDVLSLDEDVVLIKSKESHIGTPKNLALTFLDNLTRRSPRLSYNETSSLDVSSNERHLTPLKEDLPDQSSSDEEKCILEEEDSSTQSDKMKREKLSESKETNTKKDVLSLEEKVVLIESKGSHTGTPKELALRFLGNLTRGSPRLFQNESSFPDVSSNERNLTPLKEDLPDQSSSDEEKCFLIEEDSLTQSDKIKKELPDTPRGKLRKIADDSLKCSPSSALKTKTRTCPEPNKSLKEENLSKTRKSDVRKTSTPKNRLKEQKQSKTTEKSPESSEELSSASPDEEDSKESDSGNSFGFVDEIFELLSEDELDLNKQDNSDLGDEEKGEEENFFIVPPKPKTNSPEKKSKVSINILENIRVSDIKDQELLKIISDLVKSVGEDTAVNLSLEYIPNEKKDMSDCSEPEPVPTMELPMRRKNRPKPNTLSKPSSNLEIQKMNSNKKRKVKRSVRQIKPSTSSAQNDWTVVSNFKPHTSSAQNDWKTEVISHKKPSNYF